MMVNIKNFFIIMRLPKICMYIAPYDAFKGQKIFPISGSFFDVQLSLPKS